MPFCYAPWTNIDISPQGAMNPCCKFQSRSNLNIQNNTITDYTDSKYIQQIKEDFINDLWPTGCERCQIEEENNIESKRILDFARWKEHYSQVDINNATLLTASIAFGNTCNLSCITCNPYSSSRWQEEYKTIHGVDIKPLHFYKKDFVYDFLKHTPSIVHLDIPGGEPFISGVAEQKELLKHYIDTNQSKNISIHYTTNATIYPDLEWWELWAHFKEINMQLSIDGVGQRYEYLRYPAKWDTLVHHVNRYLTREKDLDNFKLSVSHTVSAYNIYYLDEFFEWCYTIGLPRPWLGRVHTPTYMQPGVWNESAKEFIVNKLTHSDNEDVNTWGNLLSNTGNSNLFEEFKNKLLAHDQYRNLNFKETFPELSTYI